MYASFPLLAKSSISIAVSLAALHTLSRPLMNVLARICPDEQAAAFWLAYTKVMLLITPLLPVLVLDIFIRFQSPMDGLRLALTAALGGILIALFMVGKRIGQFIPAPQRGDTP